MKVRSGLIRKGFLVYIILSLCTIGVIFAITVSKKNWKDFFNFKVQYVIPVTTATTIRWIVEGLGLKILIDSSSKLQISLWKTTKMRLECLFASIAVPIVGGNSMFQIYLLNREKLSIGESIAVASIRDVLPLLILFLSIPVLLLLGFHGKSHFFVTFVRVATLPVLFILLFFIVSLFYPHKIKKLISGILNFFEKHHWIKIEKIDQIRTSLHREMDILSASLKLYLKERKRALFFASLCFFVTFLVEFSVAYFIMKGINFNPNLKQSYAIQFFLKPILYLAPSPGGSGFNEFGYMGFFSIFLPKYLVGGAVLMWRSFNAYLPTIIGGILLTKDLKLKIPINKIN